MGMGNDRDQRRAKRLAKHKKRRANASRPSQDPGSIRPVAPPAAKDARTWPLGDCMVSQNYDEPSAELTAVVTRVHADGRAVAAFVELDRATDGIRSIRIKGYPSLDNVYGECASLSEKSGETILGAPAPLVVGLVVDAKEHGTSTPMGWDKLEELIADVEPMEADPPFGAPPPERSRPKGGWLDRFFRWIG